MTVEDRYPRSEDDNHIRATPLGAAKPPSQRHRSSDTRCRHIAGDRGRRCTAPATANDLCHRHDHQRRRARAIARLVLTDDTDAEVAIRAGLTVDAVAELRSQLRHPTSRP